MTEKVYKRKYTPEALEAMRVGGANGGKKSKTRTGGFFKNRELARIAGKKGGLAKANKAKRLEA